MKVAYIDNDGIIENERNITAHLACSCVMQSSTRLDMFERHILEKKSYSPMENYLPPQSPKSRWSLSHAQTHQRYHKYINKMKEAVPEDSKEKEEYEIPITLFWKKPKWTTIEVEIEVK